ncbi:MAG: THUMP domain-containing class I SAM-dependent RNA methyltransferase [Fusobacteriota bacterium]
MKKFRLIATSTFGLEGIVKKELKRLGYKNLEVSNGKVEFDGTAIDICRANIWLRCADRVLLKMGEFKARSFEQLFERTKKLPWDEILPKDAEFPVSKISSVKSKLYSKSDSQAIVKKAIVEKMKEKYNADWFEETGDKYTINVKILKDIVTISLDTSGEGLHKRGYRKDGFRAPIKETLAAALAQISKWNEYKPLIDPMCGTGTILIEAAMIAKNMAPGSNRRFAAEEWGIIPDEAWVEARDEAYSQEKETDCYILGMDVDRKALEIARENAELAMVDDVIKFEKGNARYLKSDKKRGVIITNPPYGDRLSNKEQVDSLYKDLGTQWKRKLPTWKYYVITPNEEFEKLFGKKADKNRKLYNGRIKCYLYQYYK